MQFQRAYRRAFEQLFPSPGMLDQSLLAPYFEHQQLKSGMREAKRSAQKHFIDGDRLLLFVPFKCHDCVAVINHLMSLLGSNKQSGVDVYVRDAQDEVAVRAWANAHNIKSVWLNDGRLTLNRDEGLQQRLVNQSTVSPVGVMPIFLKRNERFFQLSNESLGL